MDNATSFRKPVLNVKNINISYHHLTVVFLSLNQLNAKDPPKP